MSYLDVEGKPMPSVLEQITADVSGGLRASPVDYDPLYSKFVEQLKGEIIGVRRQFRPGGQYFEVMAALKDEDFTKQPLDVQLDMITQIDSLPEEQKDSLASSAVDRLYDCYVASPRGATGYAWSRYMSAFKLFSSYMSVQGNHRSSISMSWYEDQGMLHLPNLKQGDRLSCEQNWVNTYMQTHLARVTQILQPEETWLKFIHRDNIKKVDRWYKKTPEDEGVILGEVWGEDWDLGGMPAYYRGVPTKYPGIQALVAFDYRYELSEVARQPLDILIKKGILSPRIVLPVSNKILLGV